MRLERLTIDQLPGIDPIDITGFGSGTTFILGPNAIGKSSLVRALHYLLGEARRGDPPALALRARFVDAAHHWEVQRNGSNQRWLRDGSSIDPPPLPTPDALNCYWLRAETLIAPDDSDAQALERRLREVLAGGVDLDQVRQAAALTPPAFPQNDHRDWQAARRHREQTEQDYRRLEAQRAGRDDLVRRIDSARDAQTRLERLRQCQTLRAAVDERRALEARLASWPRELEALTGQEGEQVDDHDRQLAEWRAQCRDLDRRIAEEHAALSATGLEDQRPDRALISECRQRLDALRTAEQAYAHAAEEGAAAEAALNHAAAALAAPTDALPRLEPAQVDRLGEALQAYRDARFLEHGTRSPGDRLDWPTLGLTALSALSGLGVAAIGLATGLWMTQAGGLVTLIASASAGVRLWLQAGRGHRDLARARAEARERLDQALEQAGLGDTGYEDLGLTRLIDLIQTLDAARIRHDSGMARLAEKAGAIRQHREALVASLTPWTDALAHDTQALQSALESLDERLDRARECERALEASRRERDRLGAECEARIERKAAIYATAGLSMDDRAGLAGRLDAHARYRETQHALDQAGQREQVCRQPLSDEPALIEWAEHTDPAAIGQAIDEKHEAAAGLEPLTRELATLDTTLERTGSEATLSHAIAEEQALTERLRDRHTAYLKARAGEWLMNEVESEYRRRHEPGLLREARERFERFTHHQWSFEIGDDYQIMARDRRRDIRRPLTDLSSGTRMQLLLAARIAWARDQEANGMALPLVLDEALTNTDAERFGAVAENLERMSRDEGRQVIYLSARAEDLTRWANTVGHTPDCIDLGARRGTTDRASTRLTLAEPPGVPSPEGREAADYAALLDVPAVDPLTDVGDIHLFHLLRDALEDLYTLMSQWRVDRLGPLAAWLETPAAAHARSTLATGGTLEARIMIARAWHELARQGRSTPIDRATIRAADCFSARMAERVAAQAEALDGEPEALVASLRAKAVSHIKQPQVETFASWLESTGYLDPRAPLDAETLTRRLLERLGHQVDPIRIQTVSAWLAAGTNGLVS